MAWSDDIAQLKPIESSQWLPGHHHDGEDANSLTASSPWSAPELFWLLCDHHFEHRRVIEGLDLLAVLGRVDPPSWKKSILRIWPSAHLKWFNASDRMQHRQVEIGIQAPIASEYDLYELRQCIVVAYQLESFHDGSHGDLLDETLASKHASAPVGLRIPVRLEIKGGMDSQTVTKVLIELLNIATVQQMHTRRRLQATNGEVGSHWVEERARLEIVGIGFDPTSEHFVDAQGLSYLHQLMDQGIAVRDLPVPDIWTRLHSVDAWTSLRWLLRLPQRSQMQAEDPSLGVQTLTISNRTPAKYVWALLSAIQVSQSVRTFRVKSLSTWQAEQRWKGIAYALFSRHAAHRVTRVELDFFRFRFDDVDAMEGVLTAEDPLAPWARLQGLRAGELASSDQFFAKDPNSEDGNYCIHLDYPVSVRVMDTQAGEGVWTVLLPGWGKAWIRAPTETTNVVDESPSRCHISEIVITKLSVASLYPVAHFLKLVGHNIKRLRVIEYQEQLPLDDWCLSVIPMCPQLESFRLDTAPVQEMDALIDTLASHYPSLKQLEVGAGANTDPAQMCQFFDRFQDPSHAFSRSVQCLMSKLHIRSSDDLAQLHHLVRMLDVNRSIHIVRVGCIIPGEFRSQVETIVEEALQAAASVSIRTGPLPRQQKIGFLSAVQNNSCSSAITRLDSVIVRFIFEFAAESRTRSVDFPLMWLP